MFKGANLINVKESTNDYKDKSVFSELMLEQLSGQQDVKNIVTLDFRRGSSLNVGEITRIEYMGNLSSLTTLNLSHHKISKIENLHNLTNLRYLDISENIVEKVCEEI